MTMTSIFFTIDKCSSGSSRSNCILFLFFSLLFLVFFVFSGVHNVYGLVELFLKDGKPFGVSYDDWVSKYWNKWISMNTYEATPIPYVCLMVSNNHNQSNSFVMLMDSTEEDSPHQACSIFSNQGIMIPLSIAWCYNNNDNSNNNNNNNNSRVNDPSQKRSYTDEQLTKCAREQYNLGNIRSHVKVDGVSVAKLDVTTSLIPGSGKLDYKINSPLTNITEIYSKGFNIKIPPDSHIANLKPGIWRAGSHGWWVFLKPLPPGGHTIFYNISITPTGTLTSPGTKPHFAAITYNLDVVKYEAANP